MFKKLLMLLWLLAGLSSAAFAQTFTVTSPTTAIGAGTVSQTILITETGTTTSGTTLVFSDGGAGGSFYSTASPVAAGTNWVVGFIYEAAAGTSGNITLSVTASGGMTGSHSITLPVANNATIAAEDLFSGTSGTAMIGRTPTVGAAWTYTASSGSISEVLNGSGGMYLTGSGHAYNNPVIPTVAAGPSCDTTVTMTNINLTTTYPNVAAAETTGANLFGYRLVFVVGTGWQLIRYNGTSPTNTLFTDSTLEQLTTGANATVSIAIRHDTSGDHIFGIVNGTVLNAGAGVTDNAYTCNGDYSGFINEIPSGQTPAATDTVLSDFVVDNADWSAPGLISASPSTVPSGHSGNITLSLTGTGTSWTGSTTFSVSGVSGVSVVSKSNTSSTAETLVIATGSGTGTLTISGSDGSAGTISVATPTLSVSPSTGLISTTPTLTLTGTNTVWSQETASTLFSESGGTGASISSISVTSNTSATATLTTGSATGTETITDNSTGKTATFTISGATIVTFPNSNVFMSPYNWRLPGDGTAWAPAGGGPYLKFSVTGTTTISANVDTTINSCPASDMPTFKVIVNDMPATFQQLGTAATQVTLASGLSSGSTYTVVIYVIAGGTNCGNGWSATNSMLHLRSMQFDSGTTLSAYPIIRSKNCFILGDSFLEGYDGATYTPGTTLFYTVVDPSMTWAYQLAYALGCEVGVVGIGSQGYTNGGNNSYPVLSSSWDHYDSTHARSFSPAPDYVINAEGINDHGISGSTMQSDVQTWLTAARSALASTKIWLYIPVGGESGDETGTGGANATPIRNAVTAQGDPNVFLIDTGTSLVTADNWSYTTWFSPNDGLHPAWTSDGILAAYAAQQMQYALGGSVIGNSNSGYVQ